MTNLPKHLQDVCDELNPPDENGFTNADFIHGFMLCYEAMVGDMHKLLGARDAEVAEMVSILQLHVDFCDVRSGQRPTPELWTEMMHMSKARAALKKFKGGSE